MSVCLLAVRCVLSACAFVVVGCLLVVVGCLLVVVSVYDACCFGVLFVV